MAHTVSRGCLFLSELAISGMRPAKFRLLGASWSQLKVLRVAHRSDCAENKEQSKAGLLLSDACVERLQQITRGGIEVDDSKEDGGSKDDGVSNKMLRVIVESGGCSGFQYKFELDTSVNADDKVFERGGVKVVVDELSLSFISGSTIDYYHELIRSSFRITDNPNASLGCSCGVSFSLK